MVWRGWRRRRNLSSIAGHALDYVESALELFGRGLPSSQCALSASQFATITFTRHEPFSDEAHADDDYGQAKNAEYPELAEGRAEIE